MNIEFKEGDIMNPYPVREVDKTDKLKYFCFKKSHSHYTNECVHFKDAI